VIAKPATSLTYLRLAPLQEDEGHIVRVGVAVTRGQPPRLTEWLQNATRTGVLDVFGGNVMNPSASTSVPKRSDTRIRLTIRPRRECSGDGQKYALRENHAHI
jgi:hypothetical protein